MDDEIDDKILKSQIIKVCLNALKMILRGVLDVMKSFLM